MAVVRPSRYLCWFTATATATRKTSATSARRDMHMDPAQPGSVEEIANRLFSRAARGMVGIGKYSLHARYASMRRRLRSSSTRSSCAGRMWLYEPTDRASTGRPSRHNRQACRTHPRQAGLRVTSQDCNLGYPAYGRAKGAPWVMRIGRVRNNANVARSLSKISLFNRMVVSRQDPGSSATSGPNGCSGAGVPAGGCSSGSNCQPQSSHLASRGRIVAAASRRAIPRRLSGSLPML
jgi:hypothetical protein